MTTHGEAETFVQEYCRERGMVGSLACAPLRMAMARADAARERFKAARGACPAQAPADARVAGVDEPTLKRAEKYKRRLANNRRSAMATRVYHEVLKCETDHALKVHSELEKTRASQVKDLEQSIRIAKEERQRMRDRVGLLEKRAAKKSEVLQETSPTAVAVENGGDVAGGNCDGDRRGVSNAPKTEETVVPKGQSEKDEAEIDNTCEKNNLARSEKEANGSSIGGESTETEEEEVTRSEMESAPTRNGKESANDVIDSTKNDGERIGQGAARLPMQNTNHNSQPDVLPPRKKHRVHAEHGSNVTVDVTKLSSIARAVLTRKATDDTGTDSTNSPTESTSHGTKRPREEAVVEEPSGETSTESGPPSLFGIQPESAQFDRLLTLGLVAASQTISM